MDNSTSARSISRALALAGVLTLVAVGAGSTPSSASSRAALDGPSTAVLDDFDGRGLEDPLYQWGNWAPTSIDGSGQTLEIAGGGASHNDGDGIEADSYRAVETTGDVEAYATIRSSAENNSDMFIYINLQETGTPAWDGYRARWFHWIAVDGLYLEKVVDGVAASMVSPVQVDPATGDTLLVRNRGGTIELWHKSAGEWILRLSAADGSFSGGRIGLGMNDDGGVWDDFGGSGVTTPPPTAPEVPATGLIDQFERANEDPLSQNGAWSSAPLFGSGQTLEVLGSAAGQNEGEVVEAHSFRSDDIVGDAEVRARIANVPDNNQWFHLYLHLQEPGTAGVDGYRASWFHWIATDGVYIQKITDGAATTIAGPLALDPAAGDTLLLRRFGLQLELWRSHAGTWTKLLQSLDGSYTSGRLGLGMDDENGKWDDFGGGALTAPPPPPPPPASGPPPERSHGICDGIGIHAISTSRCLSDPVNTLTGAFVTSAEDLALPGTGASFSWSRTYTSANSTSGRLGRGWTDSYATSLEVDSNGDVRLHGDEGQVVHYTKQPDGSFAGAPGARSTLSAAAGGYELVRKDRVVYRFAAGGRLLSVKDRNAQGLSLGYDAAERLTTVTDAVGRTASVSYNAAGLVSEVATEDGRRVAYGYAGDRLSSVTDVRGSTWRYAYDSEGRLVTIVDPLGHVAVTNVYGDDGRVQSQKNAAEETTTFAWSAATETATVTDPAGNVWVDEYDANVLVARTDPLGNRTAFEHDDDLNASTVTSPAGETASMSYDARGNVLTATAPASLGGARKTFVYNASDDPTRVTDARGVVTTYAYDAAGNVESVVQDGRRVASYTYDAAGRIASSTDGNGDTTTYAYDESGNLASESDPLGNKTTYTHDDAGRVLTRVDPRGNAGGADPDDFTWRWTYDAAGNVLTERDPLGGVTTHRYDDAGNELSVTDAAGRTTSFAYDAADRLVTETGPDPDADGPLPAPVTSYTYDAAGNRRTQTDVLGRTTTFGYDAANRLVATTSPDPDGAGPLAAAVTTHAYDKDGNLTGAVEPRGNVPGASPAEYRTTFTHDAAGRLLTTTDPLGNRTTNVYDAVGNLVSTRDANGHTTTSTYDGSGRVLTVTAPDGGVTAYTYDGEGNPVTRTDALGRVTSYAYDGAGRLVSESGPDPDGPGPAGPAVSTYAYDADGNLTSSIDPNGNATAAAGDGRTAFEYDAGNRLVRIDYSDSTPDASFSYDAVGNRVTMTDGAGIETRSYDALDRLTSVTRGANTFSYGYDAVGNVARRTYPGGATVYVHDALDRLASATAAGEMTSYEYDASSNPTLTTLPAENGHVESRVYDRAGRLAEVTTRRGTTILAGFAATLDGVGNPLRIVRTGVLDETRTYAYDSSDRLVTVCFQATCGEPDDPFVRWTYDQVGNRVSEHRAGGATTSYAYDAADRLTRADSTTYTYDDNGNQISAGSRTFTYDLANRLRSTRRGSTTTTYSYDGDGIRLRSSTGSASSKTTNFIWDVNHALPQIAAERNGSGSPLRQYVYGSSRISMTSGSTTSYFHYDGLGSVVNMTSSSGSPRWTWSYEPFGAVRAEERSGGNAPTNFMRFAGEYLDPTGLYHLRAREYDPYTGRFLRPDPVDVAVGSPVIAAYVYAANRPTVMVDPSGQTFRPADDGQSHARFAVSLVPPDIPYRCIASLCGGLGIRRVHPIPKRFHPVWGGTHIHPTAGLPGYPALDFGENEGAPVVAVERGYVREFGDAAEGDALYLRGDSGIEYWYGHIRRLVTRGQSVRLGQVIGRIVHHSNGDHLHLGANTNVRGAIVGRRREGTDDRTHGTWKHGVAIMRQISRAPRVP